MNKYDWEIGVRTWLLGAILGLVTHKLGWYDTTDQASAAIGGLLGAVIDYLLYELKRFLKERKNETN